MGPFFSRLVLPTKRDCVVKTRREAPGHCGHRLTSASVLSLPQTSPLSHLIAEFPDLTSRPRGGASQSRLYSPKESDLSLELFWVQIRNEFPHVSRDAPGPYLHITLTGF